MRDCKKCKHFVKSNEGHTESLFGDLYDCEKWECEFEPEEQEPKAGHWITKPHVYGATYCSECGFELRIDNTNYCPNCGADMRGEE